jgi:hypothetical protein
LQTFRNPYKNPVRNRYIEVLGLEAPRKIEEKFRNKYKHRGFGFQILEKCYKSAVKNKKIRVWISCFIKILEKS